MRGKINNAIPVGLTRNINPRDIPERIEKILNLFVLKNQRVKNRKVKIEKDVKDKSIK